MLARDEHLTPLGQRIKHRLQSWYRRWPLTWSSTYWRLDDELHKVASQLYNAEITIGKMTLAFRTGYEHLTPLADVKGRALDDPITQAKVYELRVPEVCFRYVLGYQQMRQALDPKALQDAVVHEIALKLAVGWVEAAVPQVADMVRQHFHTRPLAVGNRINKVVAAKPRAKRVQK